MSTPTPNLKLTKPDRLESFNVELINANYDKLDAAYNALPKGILAVNTAIVQQPDITSITRQVVTSFPSITFVKGRRYLIEMEAGWFATNADVLLTLDACKDTNLSADPKSIQNIVVLTPGAEPSYNLKTAYVTVNFHYTVVYVPEVTETVQVKITGRRDVGTGNLAIRRFQAHIEDKGLA